MTSSYDRARGSVSSSGPDYGTCCRTLGPIVCILLLLSLLLLLGLLLLLVLRRRWWICRLGLR